MTQNHTQTHTEVKKNLKRRLSHQGQEACRQATVIVFFHSTATSAQVSGPSVALSDTFGASLHFRLLREPTLDSVRVLHHRGYVKKSLEGQASQV